MSNDLVNLSNRALQSFAAPGDPNPVARTSAGSV